MGTGQYRTRVKLSSKSRIPLLYLASGLVLLLLLGVQFFTSRDVRPRPLQKPPPRSGNTLSPFGESVYRQEAYFEQLEPGTQCKPKSLFSAELPVTHALTNMALEAETKRMVAQFEYTAEDVNKGVKEFIREMEEGLEKEGARLSQLSSMFDHAARKSIVLVTAVESGGASIADGSQIRPRPLPFPCQTNRSVPQSTS